MTLDIKEGQSVGIVGPSGSGKSTLLRLLLRAYDVTGGSVSVDGVDVRELKMDSLRENIAIVRRTRCSSTTRWRTTCATAERRRRTRR